MNTHHPHTPRIGQTPPIGALGPPAPRIETPLVRKDEPTVPKPIDTSVIEVPDGRTEESIQRPSHGGEGEPILAPLIPATIENRGQNDKHDRVGTIAIGKKVEPPKAGLVGGSEYVLKGMPDGNDSSRSTGLSGGESGVDGFMRGIKKALEALPPEAEGEEPPSLGPDSVPLEKLLDGTPAISADDNPEDRPRSSSRRPFLTKKYTEPVDSARLEEAVRRMARRMLRPPSE